MTRASASMRLEPIGMQAAADDDSGFMRVSWVRGGRNACRRTRAALYRNGRFHTMTTLVTGAFGCIGSWVVKRLLAAGERPVVYDLGDDPWRMRMLVGEAPLTDVTMVRGDIADKDALIRVIGEHKVDRVIHLAAWQVPLCRQDPARGALVNVVGTANVFEAVKVHRHQIVAGDVFLLGGGVRPARALRPRAGDRRLAAAPRHALRRLQGRQRGDRARLLGGAQDPVHGLPAPVGLRARPRLRPHRRSHPRHEGGRARPALSDPLGRGHRPHLCRGRGAGLHRGVHLHPGSRRASTTCTASPRRSPTWCG